MEQRRAITARERESLEIFVDDIVDENLRQNVMNNTHHYVDVAASAFDADAPADGPDGPVVVTPFDELMRQRRERLAQLRAQGNNQDDAPELNRLLGRFYEVRFVPPANEKPMRLREIRAANVGQLVSVRGIVTRTSDVQPQITVQSYLCHECGDEIYQVRFH